MTERISSPVIEDPIPSPIATGGGGEHFEQHVDAFALGLLLVGVSPPVLTNTSVVEVHLQTRHFGWRTDDLLLVGETGAGVRRKLVAQVKRTFTVSDANNECRETFQGMWDDFCSGDRFDVSVDRLAVITLHGTSTLLQSFNSLLQCAQATTNAVDFHRRLALDGYISNKAKQQHKAVQTILIEHTGASVDDDLYWRFLRTINILSFDLNTPTSQTEANVLSLLALAAGDVPDPLAAAGTTWTRLLQCAGEGRPAAQSYTRLSLPSELRERHLAIPPAHRQGLLTLVEHGKTVRNNIRSKIGHTYEIDRSRYGSALVAQLAEHQVVIVSGTAGSGKSALAKNLLDQVELDRPVLAFQAVEFATAHIDETLANAQTTLNAQRLFSLLGGHDHTLILIESIERLLEHSIRDAFSHLMQLALQHRSIHLVLTCRDYSLETVRNALLAPIGLLHSVLQLPALSDEELEQIQAIVPNLASPLRNSQLRSFLRTPYVLDLAARLDWAESRIPESARAFREKCWQELVRADGFTAGAMPRRREEAFLSVAHRRAIELRPFVQPLAPDAEALDALRQDSLIERSPESSSLYAPAHDVLEDWAILQWLDKKFAEAVDPEGMLADSIGGYPALRRGFRRWLGERFEMSPETAREFVLGILGRTELPSYFRDDCLVAALLSETAGDFLEGCKSRLADGDTYLLSQIIHILRVACKESPHWLKVPGLPSQMLVPAGTGWAPTLQLVSSLIADLLPENAQMALGLIEDWAKQIDWSNTSPAGFEAAGIIVGTLLPQFEGYRSDDARKRVLEVMLKIPRAVPQFKNLINRAGTCDRLDQTSSDLADLILGSLSGGHACRDFPAEVISLVNARLRISEADLSRNLRSSFEVSQNFGIRDNGVSDFFPASALQGPYGALLRSHPREAVAFIVDLLNHAGDWYGTQRWPGRPLEPALQILIDIPGLAPVQQWMNGRLYGLYRGMSVGPYALQSALMALESWLLAVGKMDSVNLETWLLQILRTSNNVMATSVVASVCIAYPEKAGRAGLALLSSRVLVQCDRSRLATDSPSALEILPGINPSHLIYEQERKESNRLAHRREDLESLAVRMQLTDQRESVWLIIDRHRSELPADQDEETRIWRLALHRMDVRGYRPIDAPEKVAEDSDEDGNDRVYVGPGVIESDLQTIVNTKAEYLAITNRHMRLLKCATDAWNEHSSTEQAEWRALLAEAQAIERELDEPEEFYRGGPGIVAAVCIRDQIDELNEGEFQWCAKRIESEVRRNSDCPDDTLRHGKGILKSDRAGASVVALLAVHERCSGFLDARALLALALTHPIEEVADYANYGVGAFLGDQHRDLVLRCCAAAAYRARLTAAYMEEEEELPYLERTRGSEIFDRAIPAVRQAIVGEEFETQAELTGFDFNNRVNYEASKRILNVLGYHPDWEESRQFFAHTARWLAEVWTREQRRSTGDRTRNYELEHEGRRSVARFVLKLPTEEARQICAALIDTVVSSPREAADFVHELIFAADGGADDCFWDLWQNIADKAVNASWISRLEREHSYEEQFINRIFFCTDWKDGVKHWARLDGHAHRVDALAQRLPAVPPCLRAYSRFLDTIGQQSLPAAFKVVGSVLERGDAFLMASDSSIAFHLETLLRRFVYSEPQKLKSDPALRKAILGILDVLIAGGSSSAYRMRDDFVTPLRLAAERDR